jgi:phage/plasmid-associated DNA primase
MDTVETFDAARLKYILKHFDSLPLGSDTRTVTADWNPLQFMTKYLRKSEAGKITASFSQKHPPHGRFFAVKKLSLQSFPREIRNTIAGHIYLDFDMANAQPTLCLQYCESKGYPCEAIREYVNRRDELLEELSSSSGHSRDHLKTGILSLFYGGGLTGLKLRVVPSWLMSLRLEIQRILNLVFENEPEFQKHASDTNPRGSTLSLLLQSLENDCLTAMIEKAREMEAIVNNDFVPVFDGLMMMAANVQDPESLIKGMEEHIYDRCGWRVRIIQKPMTDCVFLPEGWENDIEEEEEMLDLSMLDLSPWHESMWNTQQWQSLAKGHDLSTMDWADIIVSVDLLKNNIRYCRTSCKWYLCQNGIWRVRDDIRTDFFILLREIRRSLKCFIQAKWTEPSSDEKAHKKIMAHLYEEEKRLGDATYMNKICVVLPAVFCHEDHQSKIDTKLNLFAFSDCVYDLDTDTISRHRSDNCIMTNTGYSFPRERCEAIERDLWEFFNSMFLDPRDALYMLQTVAYCLHGNKHALDLFFCWVGRGGNGKGCMLSLIKNAFGDYYKPLPVSYLTQKRSSSSGPQPELANKVGKRCVITTEPETEEGECFRMDKIKELSDPIECRALYSKPITFDVQFGLIIQSNQDPKFSSVNDATSRRYRGLFFPIQFKSEPDPSNPYQKKADPTIKDRLALPEYRDAFIRILLDVYREYIRGKSDLEAPPNVKKYVAGVMQDNDIYGEFLKTCVNVTNHPDHKVNSVDLYQAFNAFTGDERKVDPSQFGKKMKELGISRNKRNYIGVQLIEDEDSKETFNE